MAHTKGPFTPLLVGLKDGDCGWSLSYIDPSLWPKERYLYKVSLELVDRFLVNML